VTLWQAYRALALGLGKVVVFVVFTAGSGLLIGWLMPEHPWLAVLVAVSMMAGALAMGARTMTKSGW